MHLLKKIKWFRAALWLTRPLAFLIVYPLARLRKKQKGNLFFFFDRFALGGAQRVHLDILNAVASTRKTVYFTRRSWDGTLKEEFYSVPNTHTRDIHNYCENILLRLFTIHFYAWYINRHDKASVLSSNSTFFYDMLPFLKKDVRTLELLHCFTYGTNGLEFLGLGGYVYLDERLLVDFATEKNIREQYKQYGVPSSYLDRLKVIEPGVYAPDVDVQKTALPPLKILYAGRGGPQKRIWIMDRIVKACLEKKLPVKFHFAGTAEDELSIEAQAGVVLHGQISDPQELRRLYAECHVILMTSWFEGFPMFIKEGMAFGCVPVVTALEGNKTHLRNGYNALLLDNPEDEDGVVAQAIRAIEMLIEDPERLGKLSLEAQSYAAKNFSTRRFAAAYNNLLLKDSASHSGAF